jgi:hypothetical protein
MTRRSPTADHERQIADAIAAIAARLGPGVVQRLRDMPLRDPSDRAIPSGSLGLDLATNLGGLIVTFVTLKDETGLANLVLAPDVDRASRAALHAAPFVLATGHVQRRAGVVNIQVTRVEAWWLDNRDDK